MSAGNQIRVKKRGRGERGQGAEAATLSKALLHLAASFSLSYCFFFSLFQGFLHNQAGDCVTLAPKKPLSFT